MASQVNTTSTEIGELAGGFDRLEAESRQTTGGMQRLENSIEGVGNSAGTSKQKLQGIEETLTGLARKSAPVVAGWFAVKKAIDFAEEGAQAQLIETQFNNLAGSIGTTGDILAQRLEDAGRGMTDTTSLLESASLIINTNLAQTEDRAVRLTTVATRLNLDMNQLIQTMTNDSDRRLDALKLSVERVNEIKEELDRGGFQGDSFDEAVLIALEEKMALLGDTSKENIAIYKEFRAELENTKSDLQVLASDGLAPVVSELNTMLSLFRDNREAVVTFADGVNAINGDMTAAQRIYEAVIERGESLAGVVTDGEKGVATICRS